MKKIILAVTLIGIYSASFTQIVSPAIRTLAHQVELSEKSIVENSFYEDKYPFSGETKVFGHTFCEVTPARGEKIAGEVRKIVKAEKMQVKAIASILDFCYVESQYSNYCSFKRYDDTCTTYGSTSDQDKKFVPKWLGKLNAEISDTLNRLQELFYNSKYYQLTFDRLLNQTKLIKQTDGSKIKAYSIAVTTEKPLASYSVEEIVFITQILTEDLDPTWTKADIEKAATKLMNSPDEYCKKIGEELMGLVDDAPDVL